MNNKLRLYNINEQYVSYMSMYAPHLFIQTKQNSLFSRKYIGIVLTVNGFDYFAPLSSFKEKHKRMKPEIDFIKIKDYAVININNMFPVPASEYTYVDISKEKDIHYKALLQAEYRVIKTLGNMIVKNAEQVYKHKCENSNKTALARRCNDFRVLEVACANYKK